MTPGIFITFEGVEGCGKSTQAKILWNRLNKLGIPTELTHEPGGTTLGNEVRRSLKRGRNEKISPEAELLLFAACRIQLLAEVIRPGLQAGRVIICDRFTDSTTAYQGYGRGLDLTTIEEVNESTTRGIMPDLTILLDIPSETGLSRKHTRGKDRFESEDIAFHHRVREGYIKIAALEPGRWLVIDATSSRTKVREAIWKGINHLLQERGILKNG